MGAKQSTAKEGSSAGGEGSSRRSAAGSSRAGSSKGSSSNGSAAGGAGAARGAAAAVPVGSKPGQPSAVPRHLPAAAAALNESLHSAVLTDDAGTVRDLLKLGADPESLSPINGVPALHSAASLGHVGCIKALLKGGADMNSRAPHTQQTALHAAAGTGQADSIEALIGAGADCSSRDHAGLAPLHLAACLEEVQCVRALLAAPGAEAAVAAPAPAGVESPLEVLLKHGYPPSGDVAEIVR